MVHEIGEEDELFSYKGREIRVVSAGDHGTVTVDGMEFPAARTTGMWSIKGVYNVYRDLDLLGKHIVDYLHLFQAPPRAASGRPSSGI